MVVSCFGILVLKDGTVLCLKMLYRGGCLVDPRFEVDVCVGKEEVGVFLGVYDFFLMVTTDLWDRRDRRGPVTLNKFTLNLILPLKVFTLESH